MKDGICPKCGSQNVMTDVRVIDHGDGITVKDSEVEIYLRPRAWLFKDAYSECLRAWICGGCGYVEMYIDSPQRLWEAYQEIER